MRVGLSWDFDAAASGVSSFGLALGEAATAARLGYDSAWVRESRMGPASCPHPTLLLTALSRKDATVQLRSIREVVRANPVRLAEEIAVLDQFSRGRAGLVLASAGRQGRPPGQVHETADFVRSAWVEDEFRYRGNHVRFPAHTGDDAPSGTSTPEARGSAGGYAPQWEWGPAMPDYLTITPKPHNPRPPVYAEIDDDETLEWAATSGVSPFIAADVPTDEAVDRLVRYRKVADSAGRSRVEVEVVLERAIVAEADPGDDSALGGDATGIVATVRDLHAETGLGHLVWQRRGPGDGDLFRFAVDVYPLLQG
ncbi:MAG: LLM class flavin-dependent oxidoreductase [Actinobacteria bacterium ATB1]|nr:LLM class flavin-dependent oxidoreductase [Actinobacteria bacterium ATB1]